MSISADYGGDIIHKKICVLVCPCVWVCLCVGVCGCVCPCVCVGETRYLGDIREAIIIRNRCQVKTWIQEGVNLPVLLLNCFDF